MLWVIYYSIYGNKFSTIHLRKKLILFLFHFWFTVSPNWLKNSKYSVNLANMSHMQIIQFEFKYLTFNIYICGLCIYVCMWCIKVILNFASVVQTHKHPSVTSGVEYRQHLYGLSCAKPLFALLLLLLAFVVLCSYFMKLNLMAIKHASFM